MGKITAFLLALTALCMCLTACDAEPTESVSETTAPAAETTQPQESEAETKQTSAAPAGEALPAAERAQKLAAQEGKHVSDETGSMTKEELRVLDEIAEELFAANAVHAAAVITSDLSELSPDAFASEYYNTLYGKDSTGFLVLVNNDTGEDRVYTSGACSLYLSQEEIGLAVAKATPDLVTGNYAPALEQLFQLGSAMPDTIYDQSGILSREQYDSFLAAAEEAMGDSDKQYSVLLVNTRIWQTENSLQLYADAQRQELNDDALLVVDVDELICAVSGDFDGASTLTAELNAVLQDTASLPITAAVNTYYDNMKERK